jgi:hypothetical protein
MPRSHPAGIAPSVMTLVRHARNIESDLRLNVNTFSCDKVGQSAVKARLHCTATTCKVVSKCGPSTQRREDAKFQPRMNTDEHGLFYRNHRRAVSALWRVEKAEEHIELKERPDIRLCDLCILCG